VSCFIAASSETLKNNHKKCRHVTVDFDRSMESVAKFWGNPGIS
jgi:hypothetical protein